MPNYDYKCQNCNKVFTITKSMTDLSTPNCPECKNDKVSKIWGGFTLSGKVTSSANCGSCTSSNCSTCGS